MQYVDTVLHDSLETQNYMNISTDYTCTGQNITNMALNYHIVEETQARNAVD